MLLVNDSIVVEPGYLRRVAAPRQDPRVGLVTCLYRGAADLGGALRALSIATEHPQRAGGAVTRRGGIALGSTMVFRAETLRQVAASGAGGIQ